MQYERLTLEEQIKIAADKVLECEREAFKAGLDSILNSSNNTTTPIIDTNYAVRVSRARAFLKSLQEQPPLAPSQAPY